MRTITCSSSRAVRAFSFLVPGLALAIGAWSCSSTTEVEHEPPPHETGDPAGPATAAPTTTASSTPTASASINVPTPSASGDWIKPNPKGKAIGEACAKPDDCKSGVCEGEGCSTGPKCVDASRICTRDLVSFCGCDGTTFSGSGSCPGRPYKTKGPCK